MAIDRSQITGLVLAGGRGLRMGGVDKGLQLHRGLPLVQHALQRLAPQVGPMAINANRNLSMYEALGLPVWSDARPSFAGPLAGMLAGLQRCRTEHLLTVPCDTPNFPLDLVERLAQGLLDSQADVAMVVTTRQGALLRQPVFLLMKASLRDSAARFLAGGQGKVGQWAREQGCAEVVFDEADAFFNANTDAELQQLQPGATGS